jgi:hypothetical protein
MAWGKSRRSALGFRGLISNDGDASNDRKEVSQVLDLFGWDVGMTAYAAILLVAGAVLIGVVTHVIGDVMTGWEGPTAALAAVIGGYAGSEALGTFSRWGFEFEGLFVVPALIGGIVLGFAIDAVIRYSTNGSYVHHGRPI